MEFAQLMDLGDAEGEAGAWPSCQMKDVVQTPGKFLRACFRTFGISLGHVI
jgi:hypothetical protein